MNNKNYFKDIYTDFFNIETNTQKEEQKNDIKISKDEIMKKIFDKINTLYIEEESKETLKKMIEYMRKYQENIEKNYISFRIILKINEEKTRNEIEKIIYEVSNTFSYTDKKENNKISLYDIKNETPITNNVILTNLKGINLLDNNEKEKTFFKIEEELKKENKNIIIISDNKINIDNFFIGREQLKNKYITFEIIGNNPDIQDIYNNIVKELSLEDKEKINLLDYITNTYRKDIDYKEYESKLIQYISFNKKIPELKEEKSLEEIFAELNELVGLKKVKKVLYELADMIKFKEKTKDNIKVKDINLHMVFLGNPGTGKTTIARIIAKILYNLGYIKENKLIEVSSKDLVAEYVGQTAPKTMSVIEKSLNGVLFIDEAYTLSVKEGNSYNAEAIATLIQAMENYRDKLVVIFAGYTKEMQDFLNSNSGIVSRIGYTLEFEDYTTDELIEIFKGMMNKSGFIVKEDSIDYLRKIIEDKRNNKNFGNARFIRNIYEKTVIKHASNTKDKKRSDILKTITKNDISIDNLNL